MAKLKSSGVAKMSDRHLTGNRRDFLKGAGGLGGLVAAGSSAAVAAAPAADVAAGATVVLHDPRFAFDPEVEAGFRARGIEIITIDDDPVRLWRSAIGERLSRPDTRLYGVTRWADYLIVRGLAAESRRYPRHEVHSGDGGHFTWLIA